MEKVLFNLDSIQSKEDQANIKSSIKNIDGVGKITIDPENNQVAVSYDTNTVSLTQLYECLETTGLHIRDQRSGEPDMRK